MILQVSNFVHGRIIYHLFLMVVTSVCPGTDPIIPHYITNVSNMQSLSQRQYPNSTAKQATMLVKVFVIRNNFLYCWQHVDGTIFNSSIFFFQGVFR